MSSKDSGPSAMTPWAPWAKAWTELSRTMTESVMEANRATAEAFGVLQEPTAGGSALDGPGAVVETPIEAMAYQDPDWEFEGDADTIEGLEVGDTVRFTKEISDADVRAFARASGDTNRLHLDSEFAERSRFGGRIVHGTLIAGLISAALARLPLMTIYLSQDLTFHAPAEIGEELTAVCEIVEDLGGQRFRLSTEVTDEDGDVLVDGEAVVLIDELPDEQS